MWNKIEERGKMKKLYIGLNMFLILPIVLSCDNKLPQQQDVPVIPPPSPINNPIAEKIAYGDISARAEPILRLPQTDDVNRRRSPRPYARIRSLVSIPGDSGRLAVNDMRGNFYFIDVEGREHFLYLGLDKEKISLSLSRNPREKGFIAMAFHPNFMHKGKPGYGKFYTAYSAASDSGFANYLENHAQSHESVIREWTVANPLANEFAGTSREVLRVGQFYEACNLGGIAFDPTSKEGDSDFGMLYISLGDGGDFGDIRENGQSLYSPLGAILRIDPLGGDGNRSYGIPTDNPFVGRRDAIPEIWAYGLHNPQHLSWDIESGQMFITDVGTRWVQEVNLGMAGANYGWRLREGSFATSFAYGGAQFGPVYPLPEDDEIPFAYPIAEYDRDEGGAIGSGFVYRGNSIPPLRGKYVFTEFMHGRLFYIDADAVKPGSTQRPLELRLELPGSKTLREIADNIGQKGQVGAHLGMDDSGELYLLTMSDGWVRRLAAVE